MRAFVTGASGFVGGWLRRHLEEMGDVVATLADGIDLTDPGAVSGPLTAAEPDVVYHLAALTHVGRSWENPRETYAVNVLGTVELLEAVRACRRPPRVILVSSAEVYGAGDGHPLTEESPLRPVTPYAASKVAAEFVGRQAVLGRGLPVIAARPFNHVGPGQAEFFVVSGLARRIALAEATGERSVAVGNLSAARDFTDVRDVVRAYRLLGESGVPGEVYNICSGRATPIAELFATLCAASAVEIIPSEDPALFRPVDVPLLVGSAARLTALTGWRPEIDLATTIADVLADWRARLA